MIRLWAEYSLAVMPGLKTDAAAKLEEAARTDDENGKLAAMLLAARNAPAGRARTPPRRSHAVAQAPPSPGGEDLAGTSGKATVSRGRSANCDPERSQGASNPTLCGIYAKFNYPTLQQRQPNPVDGRLGRPVLDDRPRLIGSDIDPACLRALRRLKVPGKPGRPAFPACRRRGPRRRSSKGRCRRRNGSCTPSAIAAATSGLTAPCASIRELRNAEQLGLGLVRVAHDASRVIRADARATR